METKCLIEDCKRPPKRLGYCYGHAADFEGTRMTLKKSPGCLGTKCSNPRSGNDVYCKDCKLDMKRKTRYER